MRTIKLIINTKVQKYPILIGVNLISKLYPIIKKNSIEFKKCLLVVDKNVPKKMLNRIEKTKKHEPDVS